MMEDIKSGASDLKGHVRDYVQTYTQLAKAKATKTAGTAVSGIVIGVLSFFFAFFFLFFLGFALGWWFGDLVNSRIGGFFIAAGVFALLVVALLALRKKVIVPMIRNLIIRKVYE